jgi:hypothetical protein
MRWSPMKRASVFAVLFLAGSLMAQANQDESQHPPKEKKGQVVVRGCVSRSSGHYILRSDSGNSYALEATGKIKFNHYLAQQVQVIGSESPTLNTSSSSFKPGVAPPVTILVDSINTISKQCAP